NGFAGQHKRTENELYQIEQLLFTLRYLENDGDSSQPSSVSNENTALTQIEQVFDKIRFGGSQVSLVYLVEDFKNNLAFVKKDSGNQEYDLNQAIQRIKAGKYTDLSGLEIQIGESIQDYAKHFEEKDKLVKLTE